MDLYLNWVIVLNLYPNKRDHVNNRRNFIMNKRIGIIGVGGIVNGAHISDYLTHENYEITAICDVNLEALNKTKQRGMGRGNH